ncbi:MAG TPA: SDR family oxidoreductase [Acidobacteriaceae bacterium]|nr:SDR family oxidoreductase [Acidobacteriaceae bacterium]
MNLEGKVCLVTGGSSGIGAATALALAGKGTHVAVAARRPLPLPADLLAAVSAHGMRASFVKADVADPAACRKCVDEVVSEFGALDVLIHSAGGPAPGGFYTVTEESWMNAFAVHVHSAFWLARAVAPQMAKQDGGAIILLGSAAGMRGCLGAFAYGVVKGALPHFARVLGRELADQNIRVNCVSPGVIRTPFHDAMSPEQAKNNVENRIPLHREGKPEDVAALITTLVENDFITGENMVIDGGMTMRIV